MPIPTYHTACTMFSAHQEIPIVNSTHHDRDPSRPLTSCTTHDLPAHLNTAAKTRRRPCVVTPVKDPPRHLLLLSLPLPRFARHLLFPPGDLLLGNKATHQVAKISFLILSLHHAIRSILVLTSDTPIPTASELLPEFLQPACLVLLDVPQLVGRRVPQRMVPGVFYGFVDWHGRCGALHYS